MKITTSLSYENYNNYPMKLTPFLWSNMTARKLLYLLYMYLLVKNHFHSEQRVGCGLPIPIDGS